MPFQVGWKAVGKDGRLSRKITFLNKVTIPTPNLVLSSKLLGWNMLG